MILRYNDLSAKSANVIENSLQHNISLTTLDLSNNNFHFKILNAVKRSLVRNQKLHERQQHYRVDILVALFLSQDNCFLRYATWFLQTEKMLSLLLPPELVSLIAQHATNLNAKHTQQMGAFFTKFCTKIQPPAHISPIQDQDNHAPTLQT